MHLTHTLVGISIERDGVDWLAAGKKFVSLEKEIKIWNAFLKTLGKTSDTKFTFFFSNLKRFLIQH